MLFVIAQLTIRANKHSQFQDFERQALSLMQKHGGQLLHALRPMAAPLDEIHILRFPSQEAFDSYRADPDLLALAALRAEAIASTQVTLAEKVEY